MFVVQAALSRPADAPALTVVPSEPAPLLLGAEPAADTLVWPAWGTGTLAGLGLPDGLPGAASPAVGASAVAAGSAWSPGGAAGPAPASGSALPDLGGIALLLGGLLVLAGWRRARR